MKLRAYDDDNDNGIVWKRDEEMRGDEGRADVAAIEEEDHTKLSKLRSSENFTQILMGIFFRWRAKEFFFDKKSSGTQIHWSCKEVYKGCT